MKGALRTTSLAYLVAFVGGACTLVIEIIGPRLLSRLYGSTNLVWAAMVLVTLGGLALGYCLGSRWIPRVRIALSAVLAAAGVWIAFIPAIMFMVSLAISGFGIGTILIVTSTLFLVPSILFGMVTPLCMKMGQLPGSSVVSQVEVGNLFALSTVGSIVGGLATAFWGVQHLGIRATLAIVTTLLILASVLVQMKSLPVLIVAAPGYFLWPERSVDPGTSLIAMEETAYQSVVVVSSNAGSIVTMSLGATREELFCDSAFDVTTHSVVLPYAQDIIRVCNYIPRARVLIIGGAGNALALHLEGQGYQVDTVELDSAVIRMSNNYFGEPKGQSICGDGRAFVRGCQKARYDIIIVDAFCGPTQIPLQMTTSEWFRELRSIVAQDGMVICNVIGAMSGELAEGPGILCAGMEGMFPYCYLLPSVEKSRASTICQNVLLIGSLVPRQLIGFEYTSGDRRPATDDRNGMDLIMLRTYEKALEISQRRRHRK